MQFLFIYSLKTFKFLKIKFLFPFYQILAYITFYSNGIKFTTLKSLGVPYVHISLGAKCIIGKDLLMNNSADYSDSGTNGKCRIEVRDNAILAIGDNVGMSDVTISCHQKITIGNNVLLGVGSHIRDTDNHSLNPMDWNTPKDWLNKKTAEIIIEDNVFIGAYSFILKGVAIGQNSVIGAGSVVTRSVPEGEIWAGNPAKFIRKSTIYN